MFFVIGIVAALAVLVACYRIARRYLDTRQQAQFKQTRRESILKLKQLMKRAREGDKKAFTELGKGHGQRYPWSWSWLADREGLGRQYRSIARQYEGQRGYDAWINNILRWFREYQSASSYGDRIQAGVQVISFSYRHLTPLQRRSLPREHGIDLGLVVSSVNALLRRRYSQLLGKLESSVQPDQASYCKLYDLIVETRKNGHYDVEGISRLRFPKNWSEIVAKHVVNPHLSDFATEKKDLAKGTVRLMAAKALQEHDIVKAKLVLAFCNHDSYWRKEVGQLAGHLALMVTKIEKRQEALALATSE